MRYIDIDSSEKNGYIEFSVSCKTENEEVYKVYLGDSINFLPLCVAEISGSRLFAKTKVAKSKLKAIGYYPNIPKKGFLFKVGEHVQHIEKEAKPSLLDRNNALNEVKKYTCLTLCCEFSKNLECPLLFMASVCKLDTENKLIYYTFRL